MTDNQPKNIDGYPVVREIGSGASGTVYQVKLPGKQRYAALKLFKGEVNQAEELRFKREFGAIARCRHEGIVSVYGIGDAAGRPYILMEFVKGKPFDQALRAGLREMESFPLDRKEKLVDALNQILETLRYLHGRKIIHRDIKPGNIVWTDDNKIKLLDFGMAWVKTSRSDSDSGGTAGYQAPELFLHKRVDPRSDLYSLGVCLYTIITGYHPFARFSGWQELIERQLEQKFNRLSVMNPAYGDIWEHYTGRLMHPEPSDRFQSAIHAIVDLSRIASFSNKSCDEILPDESEWEMFATSWIGPVKLLDQVRAELKEGNNVIYDVPSRGGRTRFLDEVSNRTTEKYQSLYIDCRTAGADLWLKRIFQFEDFDKNDCNETLVAARAIIESFIDKKQQIKDESPETFRDTFLHALKIYLSGISVKRDILLLMDNIEYAEDVSLKVFALLAQIDWIKIVATAITAKLSIPENMTKLTWKPASKINVKNLIQQKLGMTANPHDSFVKKLKELSEGKLGQIVMFLESWFLSDNLKSENNKWCLTPPSVTDKYFLTDKNAEEFLKKSPVRTRKMPAKNRLEREILRLVSTCHQPCLFSVISGVFAARESLVLQAIDSLLREGWLQESVECSQVVYSFIESQDQQMVYSSLSPFHRRYLHRRVSEILQKLKGIDSVIIAEHLSGAENSLDGIEIIQAAADAAKDRFDNQIALNLYASLQKNLGNAIRNSVDAVNGADDWIFRFDGLSQAMLYEGARNARSNMMNSLQRTRLQTFRARGNIFGRVGDYGAAFDIFQHMLTAARDSGHRDLESDALRLIGQILYYQRKLDEAEKYFNQSLEIRKSENDRAGIADCLNALGVLSQQKQELSQAMDYFRKSLKIKIELEDKRGIVYIRNNIANIYYDMGKLKEALEEFESTVEVFRELDDNLGLAYSLYNIGGVNIEMKRFSVSIGFLEESLEIRRKMQDLQDMGHCLWQLATALEGADRIQEAIERITEAISVLEKVGLSDDAEECRKMLEKLSKMK